IAARGPVTIVASVGLVWTASTIFYVLTDTMNDIWGVERSRPFWKRRGQAILFVLVFIGPVLFLASFANNLIASFLSGLPSQVSLILSGNSLVVALLLDIAFFWAIYIFLPHAHSAWRKLLPGAIAAGLLWEIAKKIFLSFVTTYISVSNLVYGSVAAIIAFLIWAFLSGHILLFGAFLNVAYNRKLRKQLTKTKRSKHR
ncbi:MAG: YihY/virulence factor BrkB family protein, partial [Anaerolineales bacterium]